LVVVVVVVVCVLRLLVVINNPLFTTISNQQPSIYQQPINMSESSWTCPTCTYLNPSSGVCAMCGAARVAREQKEGPAPILRNQEARNRRDQERNIFRTKYKANVPEGMVCVTLEIPGRRYISTHRLNLQELQRQTGVHRIQVLIQPLTCTGGVQCVYVYLYECSVCATCSSSSL
jgi:hypothetical protein